MVHYDIRSLRAGNVGGNSVERAVFSADMRHVGVAVLGHDAVITMPDCRISSVYIICRGFDITAVRIEEVPVVILKSRYVAD